MWHSIILLALAGFNISNSTNTDTTNTKVQHLDEVVITDFKDDNKKLSPVSVSFAGARLLRNQQIVSIKDLTAVLPNFYMPDYGSRANTPVYIRGIGAKTNGSGVGFYVDGVPHFESSAFDIDLADVAEVEVLRGPQGTLYGRNAIGGIINVYTYNPLQYQNTRIKASYGRYNDMRASVSHYMKLSNHLGLALSGAYHHTDGMFRNSFLKEKADDMDEGNGRLGLYWQPTENLMMRLNSTLEYSDQGGFPYAPYDMETNELQSVSYNRYSSYRRLISSNGFNINYNGAGFSLNSQTSYQFIKSHQGVDQDFTPQDKYFTVNEYHQNMVSQEITMKSNNDSRYQWITGIFGMMMGSSQFVRNNSYEKGIATPFTFRTPTASFAIYHQSSYNIWRGLSASVGLRFDYEHAKSTYSRNVVSLKTEESKSHTEINSKDNFRQFTPKFTLQYRTTEDNLFYGSITRGYKPGGFNKTFQNDNERSFNPEYSWNYEVGLRNNFFDKRLSTELTLFYIDWRHMQITYTIAGVGNMITNAGHTDSKGVELGVTYRPINGLLFQLNYGYTHARFLDYHKSKTLDYSGNRLPMVPNHTLSVNGSYTLQPKGWLDRVVLSAGLTGLGRIYWGEDNVVKQNFYALLNAKASFTKGIFTWELWGKNLTDTYYMAYGFKSTSGNYAQQGKPLTFGTSIEINF